MKENVVEVLNSTSLSHFDRIIPRLCFKFKYDVHVTFYTESIFQEFEIKFYPTHIKKSILAFVFSAEGHVHTSTSSEKWNTLGSQTWPGWGHAEDKQHVTAICGHTKTTWWVTRAHLSWGVSNKNTDVLLVDWSCFWSQCEGHGEYEESQNILKTLLRDH